jgi:hypothetical protein
MKQEILCYPACSNRARAKFPTDNPSPGDHVSFIKGMAKKDFICNCCFRPIGAADDCCAFSIWADGQEKPDWEKEFIAEGKAFK